MSAPTRCPAIDPQGRQCGLVAGHVGVHQVPASDPGWGPPLAASTAPPQPSQPGAMWSASTAPAKQSPSVVVSLLKLGGTVLVGLFVLGVISNLARGGTGGGGSGGATTRPAAAAARSPVTVSGSGISKT